MCYLPSATIKDLSKRDGELPIRGHDAHEVVFT